MAEDSEKNEEIISTVANGEKIKLDSVMVCSPLSFSEQDIIAID